MSLYLNHIYLRLLLASGPVITSFRLIMALFASNSNPSISNCNFINNVPGGTLHMRNGQWQEEDHDPARPPPQRSQSNYCKYGTTSISASKSLFEVREDPPDNRRQNNRPWVPRPNQGTIPNIMFSFLTFFTIISKVFHLSMCRTEVTGTNFKLQHSNNRWGLVVLPVVHTCRKLMPLSTKWNSKCDRTLGGLCSPRRDRCQTETMISSTLIPLHRTTSRGEILYTLTWLIP